MRKINVKGTVKSQDQSPIIGANVLLKGSSLGTVTNENGAFSINVPSESILEISLRRLCNTGSNH